MLRQQLQSLQENHRYYVWFCFYFQEFFQSNINQKAEELGAYSEKKCRTKCYLVHQGLVTHRIGHKPRDNFF